MGSSPPRRPTLRMKDLCEDLFADTPSPPAPHPDYEAAARRLSADPEGRAKLERLCEDLESIVSLNAGPGSFRNLARVPLEALRPLEGRCWREILLDPSLGPMTWTGIRNYARVLKAAEMDGASQRSGLILHAVAVGRLEEHGLVEADPEKRRRQLRERKAVLGKPYLPAFVARELGHAEKGAPAGD
jgi:hypothetical protein